MTTPVQLGQFAKEPVVEEAPPPVDLATDGLCRNCFHQQVCHIYWSIRLMNECAAIGRCQYYLPVNDLREQLEHIEPKPG